MTFVPFFFTLFSIATACSIHPISSLPSSISLSDAPVTLDLSLKLCNAEPEHLNITSSLDPTVKTFTATPQNPSCYIIDLQLHFSTIGRSDVIVSVQACQYTFPLVVSGFIVRQNGDIVSKPSTNPAVINRLLRARLAAQLVFPNGTRLGGPDLAPLLQVELQNVPPTLTSRVEKLSRNIVIDAARFVKVSRPVSARFMVRINLRGSQMYTQFELLVPPFMPIVRRIRTSRPLRITGGNIVTVHAIFAFGFTRRLVLFSDSRRITIRETSCIRRSFRFTCSFLLPDTSRLGFNPQWTFEVARGAQINAAIDESNFVFRFQMKPFITDINPSFASRQDTLVVLTGGFPKGNLRLLFGGENIPAVRRGFTQLFFRIPSHIFDVAKQVEIIVIVDGRRSVPVLFDIDPDALDVELIPLQSSFDTDTGYFFFPSVCGKYVSPAVKARLVATDVFNVPNYEFSILISSDSEFKTLSTSNSSTVALSARLFSTELDPDEVLALRVRVVLRKDVGEKVILISRQLREDIVGVTVDEIPRIFNGMESCILESSVSSVIQCPNSQDLVLRFEWKFNDAIVRSQATESTSLESLREPTMLGLGNRLAIPSSDDPEDNYELSVKLYDRKRRSLIREGFASGTKRNLPSQSPVALINGGAAEVWVPQNSENYMIEGEFLTNRVRSSGKHSTAYEWACAQLSNPKLKCPSALFPFSRRTESTKAASFTVSTMDIAVNSTFVYSLRVIIDGVSSEVANLSLLVAEQELPPFPAAGFISASGLLLSGSSFDGINPILFALRSLNTTMAIDFALFASGQPEELLQNRETDLLIRQPGYWTPSDETAIFLGINSRDLNPGSYTLYGALNNSAGPSRGSSWLFTLEETPQLIIDEPVVRSGISNRTVFYASASSAPESNFLFFYALRNSSDPVQENMTGPLVNLSDCLQGCTGTDAISFTAPNSGEFNIVVDMYDSSGTRLIASASTENKISVRNPTNVIESSDKSSEGLLEVGVARALANEDAIFEAIQQLLVDQDARQADFAESVLILESLVSTSFPVLLQGAKIINLSASIMEQEQVRSLRLLGRLRNIVHNAVQRSPLTEPVASLLKEPLTLFYSAATNKLRFIKASNGDERMMSMTAKLANAAVETRLSASSNIIIVLSAGQTCGTLEQLSIPLDVQPGFNLSSGIAEAEVLEDFRIGISCFPGQIESLLPSPADLSVCPEAVTRDGSIQDDLRILASSEQYDLMKEDQDDIVLSGLILTTQLLRRATEIGAGALLNGSTAILDCYESQPSALLTEEIGGGVTPFFGIRSILCQGAGEFLSVVNGGDNDVLGNANEFEVNPDGRISSSFLSSVPSTFQLRLNATRMNDCLQDLDGDSSVSLAVLLPVLLAAIAVLILIVAGFIRRRRRANNNGRDAHSVPSSAIAGVPTAGSPALTQNTSESARVLLEDLDVSGNQYAQEYTPVTPEGTTEGQNQRSQSSSGTEDNDPDVSRSIPSIPPDSPKETTRGAAFRNFIAARGRLHRAKHASNSSPETIPNDFKDFEMAGEIPGNLPQELVIRDRYGRGLA